MANSDNEAWEAVVGVALLIIAIIMIARILFLLSVFVFIISLVLIIFLLVSNNSESMHPILLYFLFGSLIVMPISYVVGYSIPATEPGKLVVDTSNDIIYIDEQMDELESNITRTFCVQTVEAFAPFFPKREESIAYVDTVKEEYEVPYTENVSYLNFYAQSIYGERLTNLSSSESYDTECHQSKCTTHIRLVNTKRNHSLNVDLNFTVLVHDGFEKDSFPKQQRNLTIPAYDAYKLLSDVEYSAKEYPYTAEIDADSLAYSFLPNDYVSIENETLYQEVNKTRIEFEYKKVNKTKTVKVIDSGNYRFLVGMCGLI